MCPIGLNKSSSAFITHTGAPGIPDVVPSGEAQDAAQGFPVLTAQQNHSHVELFRTPRTESSHQNSSNPPLIIQKCSQLLITASGPSSPNVDVYAKYNCDTVVQQKKKM